MSKQEDIIKKDYQELISLMWTCVFSEDRETRLKNGKLFFKRLEQNKKATIKANEIVTQLIDKLTEAAQIITDMNDLLECCYKALGKRSIDIVNTWKILKDKKKKREDRKD